MSSFLNNHFKTIFITYLSFIFLAAIYHLYDKHLGGLDSTISEWLINYLGGFTRRGLIGHLFAIISIEYGFKIRQIILIFQILIYFLLLISIYKYFKNYKKNFIFYLCLFCPLFLTYHVAELEILARKEIIVFLNFILLLFIIENINYRKYAYIYTLITLPFIILVWEPVVFFIPFYFFILFFDKKNKNLQHFFLKNVITFFPSALVVLFLLLNTYTEFNEKLMCDNMKILLNERCYMSLGYLDTTISDNFNSLFRDIKFSHIIRYSLIYLIGFSPLLYLLIYMKFNRSIMIKILIKYNIIKIYFLISLPIAVLFMMGLDWGRWINIYYFFTLTTVYFLLKNNIYTISENKLKKFNILISFNKKYLLIIIFLLFCLGWNPKTLYKEDVASFPGYRVPYKLIKSIYNNF